MDEQAAPTSPPSSAHALPYVSAVSVCPGKSCTEWRAAAGKFVFAGRFLTPRLLFHSRVLGKSPGPEVLSHLSGQCWRFLTFAAHSSVRGIGGGGTLGETMINWCVASCLLRDAVSLSLLFASGTCEFSKKQLFVQADIVLWVDQARGINRLC